jgi:hypothetical protein
MCDSWQLIGAMLDEDSSMSLRLYDMYTKKGDKDLTKIIKEIQNGDHLTFKRIQSS